MKQTVSKRVKSLCETIDKLVNENQPVEILYAISYEIERLMSGNKWLCYEATEPLRLSHGLHNGKDVVQTIFLGEFDQTVYHIWFPNQEVADKYVM